MGAMGWVLVLGWVIPVMAYEAVEVSNGGSVKGKVTIAGPAPKDETLRIDKDQNVCGTSQPAHKYVISNKGEVQGALVVVEDVQKGRSAPKQDLAIENRECHFDPLVGIAYTGSQYVIKNSDPVFHNTKLLLQVGMDFKNVYNLAFPKQGQVIQKPVQKAGFIHVKCNAHTWMRAYVYASEHPYVAVTGQDGSFEIKDLPPGKYTLKAWHEGLGEQKKTIEIVSGKVTEATIQYTK
jgi:hypothetical protein